MVISVFCTFSREHQFPLPVTLKVVPSVPDGSSLVSVVFPSPVVFLWVPPVPARCFSPSAVLLSTEYGHLPEGWRLVALGGWNDGQLMEFHGHDVWSHLGKIYLQISLTFCVASNLTVIF